MAGSLAEDGKDLDEVPRLWDLGLDLGLGLHQPRKSKANLESKIS